MQEQTNQAACESRKAKHRGHWGRKLLVVVAVFGVIATGSYLGAKSAQAFGAGRHAMWGGHASPEVTGKRIEAMVSFILADVDASADQKSKIADIAKTAFADLAPLRAEHEAARAKVIELLVATPTIDRAALEVIRVAELRLADTASKRVTQAVVDAAELLEPAQRARLVEKMKHRRGPRG